MIYKNNDEVQNNSYINKDFQALWEELLELIPKFTNKWNPLEANESDPLAVLLKVLAIYSDKLNYNIDKSILERFPQTLTELRSAKNVYETLGYNAPWYKAASTSLTFTYFKKLTDNITNSSTKFYIPRFTEFSDIDRSIVYTLIKKVEFGINDYLDNKKKVLLGEALQGTINDYIINGVERITVDNLDSNNRLYFTEPNVAYNGIFIDTNEDFSTSNSWVRVDNIYQSIDSATMHPYLFGVDPVSGACYIEFADTIANSIGSGLYIKYIVTDGADGNTKARSINSCFKEDTYLTDNEGNTTIELEVSGELSNISNVKLDKYISIINASAAQNGTNPATIDEMYKNYKRVKNTFDTLVTVLDYENYLYRYEKKDGTNVVSNIRVSDRTNDLLDSYRVWTMDTRQEVLRTKVAPKSSSDSTPAMTSNTIKFYPLNPIPTRGVASKITLKGTLDPTDFNNTFSNSTFWDEDKPNEATFGSPTIIKDNDSNPSDLMNIVENTKTMTTDIYPYPCDLIFIPYNLVGQIYLSNSVSKLVAQEVKVNVDKALYNALNSRELDFGKEISYIDVLNIVKGADDRIAYVALNPIEYEAPELPKLKYVDGGETVTDGDKVVTQKAMLNGNTPWTKFEEDFTYLANLKDGNIENFTPTITINSEVELDNKSNAQYYKVEKNEDVVMFAPQYKDEVTYSNYLYYLTNVSIDKDTPYKLLPGQYIYIYSSKPTATTVNEYKYKLVLGDVIRTSFKMTGIPITDNPIKPDYLNTEKTIAKIGYVQGELSEEKVNWITNSKTLVTKLSTAITWVNEKPTSDAYTLKTGEYFLFQVVGEDGLTLLGEGNTIASSSILDISGVNTDAWFEADWNSLLEGNETDTVQWALNDGTAMFYRLNLIYVFGDDYTFRYIDDEEIVLPNGFENWLGDGTIFDVTTLEVITTNIKKEGNFWCCANKSIPAGTIYTIKSDDKIIYGESLSFSLVTSLLTESDFNSGTYFIRSGTDPNYIFNLATQFSQAVAGSYGYYTVSGSTSINVGTTIMATFTMNTTVVNLSNQTIFDVTVTSSNKLQYTDSKASGFSDSDFKDLPSLIEGDNWKGFVRLAYTLGDKGFKLSNYSDYSGNNYVTHNLQINIKDSLTSTTKEYEDITIQCNVGIESTGGIEVTLTDSLLDALLDTTGSTLKIYSYLVNEELNTTANFVKLSAGNWTVPGPSDYVAIFGAYTNDTENSKIKYGASEPYVEVADCWLDNEDNPQGSTVFYFAAECNTMLVIEGEVFVSQVKVVKKVQSDDSNTTYGWLGELIGDLVSDVKPVVRLTVTELGDATFNPTHSIDNSALIMKPTEAINYFNRNHPMNRYVLPKLKSLEGLVINQYSINT